MNDQATLKQLAAQNDFVHTVRLIHTLSGRPSPACYMVPSGPDSQVIKRDKNAPPTIVLMVEDEMLASVDVAATTMKAGIVEVTKSTSIAVLSLGNGEIKVSASELGLLFDGETFELDVAYVTKSDVTLVRHQSETDIAEDLCLSTMVAQSNDKQSDTTPLKLVDESFQLGVTLIRDIYFMTG